MSQNSLRAWVSLLAFPATFAFGDTAACPKLPSTATPPALRATADADWSRWDPKLAVALKNLWQRSVLAVSQQTHASVGSAKTTSRRPAAEGPFDASAWEVPGATLVAFRVRIVPPAETDQASMRVERFTGLWRKGKLERLDGDCLRSIEPAYFDAASKTVYGKPLSGECLTAACPLPTL